jgi:hypothetical protein
MHSSEKEFYSDWQPAGAASSPKFASLAASARVAGPVKH